MGNNLPKGELMSHIILQWHHWGIKGPQGSLKEELASYQLVGEVTAHQGDDG